VVVAGRVVGGRLVGAWVTAGVLGGAVATILILLVSWGTFVAGAVVGTAQWLVIRRIARIGPAWVVATAITLPAAVVLGAALVDFLLGAVQALPIPHTGANAGVTQVLQFLKDGLTVLSIALGASVPGAVVGLAQGLAARWSRARLAVWVKYSLVAGLFATLIGGVLRIWLGFAIWLWMRATRGADSGTIPFDLAVAIVLNGALAGAVYGCISARGLWVMFAPPVTRGAAQQRVEGA
jgi:hypothetical protein